MDAKLTQQDLHDLLQAVPLPMMVIDGGKHVAATNAALDTLLGRGLVGRHFITALRQPVLLDAIEDVLRSRMFRKGRFLGRDGTRDTSYVVHIAPVSRWTVLTFEDHTAKEDISQLRRDFVANVSHELRTPLTALYGFIETMRGPAKNDNAAQERFLGIMERETQRMTRLVDDLLSLSRVEENERVRPQDRVVLSELVRATATELEPVVKQVDATIRIQDDSDGAGIPGDPGQLRQVVGNLIENAVKYGPQSGVVAVQIKPVRFETSLRQMGITLAITNDGDGIAAHHIARLTERFYRVDTHRSREIGGTGLGLAIVKHIVNRHRGRLKIESDEGAPTTVTVVLPADLPDDPASG